jgi:hypothetical protein
MSRVTVVLEQWQADALDMLAQSQRRQEGVPASRSSVLRDLLERALEPYRPEPAPVDTPVAKQQEAQPCGSASPIKLPLHVLRN